MFSQLPLSRRDIIETRLTEGHTIVAALLATEFSVSEDAVRRDLRALAAEGKCRRVYGGALPIQQLRHPLSVRIEQGSEAKRALAKMAAESIVPGEFIFLDSGSTNLGLVEFLPPNSGISVATNSADISVALLRRNEFPILLIGGHVDLMVGGCIDAAAVEAAENLNIDRCFLGACAVSAAKGVCVHDHADAIFKRTLLKQSSLTIVMATNDKLQVSAPHRIGVASDFDLLVVESNLSPSDREELVGAGYELLHATSTTLTP